MRAQSADLEAARHFLQVAKLIGSEEAAAAEPEET